MKRAPAVLWTLAVCCGGLGACDRPGSGGPRDAPATSLGAVILDADDTIERVAPDAWASTAAQFADAIKGLALHATPGALVLAMEQRRFEPTVLTRTDSQPLTGATASAGAAIVVGSGFVSEFQSLEPLGLLQIDGKIVSPVSPHGYTRILGVRNGRLGVLARREYHRGLLESALQVGPGIVEGGTLDISPRERNLPAYFRAFIATCDGRDLAGVTTRPMHLFDLGNQLLDLFETAALDCSEVANLSGDREALLGLRTGARTFFVGNPNSARAALIAFRDTASGSRHGRPE